jgi:hypothetical protein
MKARDDEFRSQRPANSLQPWLAPVRNHDWIAARIVLN